VLVLDPMLIPLSVDVVIGGNVYELHFRVEHEDMQDALKPLDMEDDSDEFDKKEEEEGAINVTSCQRIGRWTVAQAGNLEEIQMDLMMATKGKIKWKTLLPMRILCRWRCLIRRSEIVRCNEMKLNLIVKMS
jgi:hypothetical protein